MPCPQLRSYSTRDRLFGAVNWVLLGLFAASTAYPFIYILAVSLSSGAAVTANRVFLFPVDLTVAAFGRVVTDELFWRSYANTLFYTVFGTITSLAFIIPGAYALSKQRLRGRRIIGFFLAFTMWFQAGMIPFFLNMRDLGLLDSRIGILVGFAVNAFNVILMRNYFESISPSFEEAARMDGANDFQVLWKVFLPLSKPAIATITLLCAITRWNGYFWSMVLLRDEAKIPLQGLPAQDHHQHHRRRRIRRRAGTCRLFDGDRRRRDHRDVHRPGADRLSVRAEVLHQGRHARRR